LSFAPRELLLSDESRALRHIFFAERAASKIADVPEDTPTAISRKWA
jgi:3-hydroxyacyl-CoA dehydrogenase